MKMHLSSDFYIRFEPEINGGTLYLFNKRSQKIYKTKRFLYDIIRHINAEEIEQMIREEYKLPIETNLTDSIHAGIKKLMEIGALIDEAEN